MQKEYKLAKKQKSFNLIQFICGVFFVTILLVLTIWINSSCDLLNIQIDEMSRKLTHYRNDHTNIQNNITFLSRSDRVQRIEKQEIKMVDSVIEPIDIVLHDK